MADQILTIDCETGDVTARDLTADEQAAYDAETARVAAEALAAQWELVYTERDLRLHGTDWIVDPPTDLPQNVRNEIATYELDWLAYRDGVRGVDGQADPYAIEWPIPPPAPSLAITAQPDGAARLARLLGG